ncbi:hypothetical protein GPECTOR_32g477 [Gonium pectorale]|uniref:Uncharacterized protein n=1 Tax=Gonium pectorale TaxID=33097 RepID=A0A150GDE7_GONPE|nr:hypothetical protein GPECTOR_32g477 [Gonium pectorale]|eukprot:KXZ47864.1 hypothetical protein GPECTOR_32g477 [Gonium pectorale]
METPDALPTSLVRAEYTSPAAPVPVPSAATSRCTAAVGSPFSSAAAASSPSAVLAASLVRSRATYFERLTSNSRASTSAPGGSGTGGSGGGSGDAALTGVAAEVEEAPPTPRHSAMLSPHPLHPLAPHPLSRAGSGGSWVSGSSREDGGPDDCRDDIESVDTFFDRPSYTQYGIVEMSSVSSSSRRAPAPGAAAQEQGFPQQQPTGPAACSDGGGNRSAAAGDGGASASAASPSASAAAASAAAASAPGSGSDAPPAPAAELAAVGGRGYVRSMSARFGRMSSGGGGGVRGFGGGGSGGMDGLFDDLVAHVGALLACHPDVEAQMGMVQGLSDKLLQLHEVCERLERKEDEVEHLRGVLRELTQTRAQAVRLKVQMAESLNSLQQEYYRVLRSAQMAQSTAKLHAARAAATRKQLNDTQSELGRYKRALATLRDRSRRLRADNDDMAARLAALERAGAGREVRHSACYLAMVQAQTAVLY